MVRDEKGRWFSTHDSAHAGGVWLAPLYWNGTLHESLVTLVRGSAMDEPDPIH